MSDAARAAPPPSTGRYHGVVARSPSSVASSVAGVMSA
jgi:hypothetical protein